MMGGFDRLLRGKERGRIPLGIAIYKQGHKSIGYYEADEKKLNRFMVDTRDTLGWAAQIPSQAEIGCGHGTLGGRYPGFPLAGVTGKHFLSFPGK
jgi:hypothetical protein